MLNLYSENFLKIGSPAIGDLVVEIGELRPERDIDRVVIASVPRDTPAWQYGLNVEDEILAIDGYRVMADDLEERLEYFPPGREVEVLISRRGALRTLLIPLGKEPETSFEIEIDPDASSDREARRRAWLDGS